MRRLQKIIAILFTVVLLGITSQPLHAEPQEWEPIKSIENTAKTVSQNTEIEIFTTSSRIMVNVNQPVKIEIFTILGKLVSSQSLNPGTYEYKLNSHGIFIIKSSELTCKVAV